MHEASKDAQGSTMAKGKVFILQGVSGAGKSTVAAKLIEGLPRGKQVCVSADQYFIDEKGEYRFDVSKLGAAHQWCLRNYTHALLDQPKGTASKLVVVDNTNTTMGEVAPYYALAEALGFEPLILVVGYGLSWSQCAERNVHGVPLAGVLAQGDRIVAFGESRPPWWNWQTLETFEAEGGFEKLSQFKKEVL